MKKTALAAGAVSLLTRGTSLGDPNATATATATAPQDKKLKSYKLTITMWVKADGGWSSNMDDGEVRNPKTHPATQPPVNAVPHQEEGDGKMTHQVFETLN